MTTSREGRPGAKGIPGSWATHGPFREGSRLLRQNHRAMWGSLGEAAAGVDGGGSRVWTASPREGFIPKAVMSHYSCSLIIYLPLRAQVPGSRRDGDVDEMEGES